MEQEKIIEKLNKHCQFEIKRINKEQLEIITYKGNKIVLENTSDRILEIIDDCIDKQDFSNDIKDIKVVRHGVCLTNLRFDFIDSKEQSEWDSICKKSYNYLEKSDNKYCALIRLAHVDGNIFTVLGIDRDRKIWGF